MSFLDIISGERSQALNGFVSLTRWRVWIVWDWDWNSRQREQFVILTPVEAEPEDPLVSDKQQQEDPHSAGVEPPHKRRRLEKDPWEGRETDLSSWGAD